MIDHFNLPVSDLARSRSFYERVLARLGYGFVMQDGAAAGFGRDSWEFGILATASPISENPPGVHSFESASGGSVLLSRDGGWRGLERRSRAAARLLTHILRRLCD
jgi:catechol 2,3-dioxygenase-like lactoylglutathione lyase family enzyme